MKKGVIVAIILVVFVLAVGAYFIFGKNYYSASPNQGASGATAGTAVKIQNFQFMPGNLAVKVGDKVTWTNEDDAPHQIASDNGKFDSAQLENGDIFEFTFTEAGIYNYHCGIHSGMKGKVVVS